MRLPARGIHVHHSVTEASDYDPVLEPTDDPNGDMRTIERIGIQRFGYLSYSYAFHPSGVELEGMGTRIGAHTKDYNSTSFGFVLIGNYEIYEPTDPQLRAMARRARLLIEDGLLVEDFYLLPHQRRKATACPGKHMVSRLDDLLTIIRSPQEEPSVMPNPYQHLLKVTLPEPHGRWGKGTHWFHVSGTDAVHVRGVGLAYCQNVLKLPVIISTDGPGFLDAHALVFGTA
ncbi:peptidoglycan recognition family protein [Euzebya tangerina]|uniref:peptidoglycan recognition protein family protein n=1 Tax=Euzebya tangerina TaxID=591198 RepID=UPI0023E89884|nr:peptidoglycan recognition family protein [Euzebya tangerina]